MVTKQQPKRAATDENTDPDKVPYLIEQWILAFLGQPEDLHKVQVRRLWSGHYRVNVLVGPNAASVRVAHSYFLEANDDGDIVSSTPCVTKQY